MARASGRAIQSSATTRSRSARTGRQATEPPVLRERDEHRAHRGRAVADAVSQGRHQRPRRERREDRQPEGHGDQGGGVVPGECPERRFRRAQAPTAQDRQVGCEGRSTEGGEPTQGHRPPRLAIRRDDAPPRDRGRRVLHGPPPPEHHRRRGPGHAPGLCRDALEQAVLRLQRGPLARRRSRAPTATGGAPQHAQCSVAPLRCGGHHLDAGSLGVPLVRGLGPCVPRGHVRPHRSGVREIPAALALSGVVPAPEWRAAGLRVVVRRREPAGPCGRGLPGLGDRWAPRHQSSSSGSSTSCC